MTDAHANKSQSQKLAIIHSWICHLELLFICLLDIIRGKNLSHLQKFILAKNILFKQFAKAYTHKVKKNCEV